MVINQNEFDENLIKVRREPSIYAFSTDSFPNHLKIGDTFRSVDLRISEWTKKLQISLGNDQVKLNKEFEKVSLIDDVYFRDYSIHTFLKDELKKNNISDSEQIKLYSKEFFYDTSIEDIEKAISAITEDYKSENANKKYTFYRLEDRKPDDFHYANDKDWQLRPNQKLVVENFLKMKDNHKELLMYAVMRFGKSFTAMQCALQMQANKVLIVSAKADVATEWKKTVEMPKCFKDFKFLTDKDFKDDKDIISKANKVAVFLTLQNLSGKDKDGNNIKTKLKSAFETEYDLIIVDETHYGAWAEVYGASLKNKEEDADSIIESLNEQKHFEEKQKNLKAKLKLHLSGTPYNLLYDKKFNKDNMIASVQFSDILNEKEKWDRENFENIENEVKNPETNQRYQEFDNPYFGFPQMLRFAFNPSEQARNVLKNATKNGEKWTLSNLFETKEKKPTEFKYENEVLNLLKIIDGSEHDDNILSFLDIPKIKNNDVCKHMVFVLPYKYSCDAMEILLDKHKNEFKHLNQYEVLNITGHNLKAELNSVEKVKQKIEDCEKQNPVQKTITLTVNKMLTGVTVKEWDTMIMLKNTHSPQEYDQAVFRIQNQYIKEYVADDGSVIKKDMKPQTILVDFDPLRIFEIQGLSTKIINSISSEKKSLDEAVAKELNFFPIITYNGKNLVKVQPENIIEIITQYNKEKSILEEALSIELNPEILKDSYVLNFIQNQSMLTLTNSLTANAYTGEKNDFDTPEDEDEEKQKIVRTSSPSNTQPENNDIAELNKRFRMCMANILFYAFLSPSSLDSLESIVDSVKEGEKAIVNQRIFKNLKLDLPFIERLINQKSTAFTFDIDNKIYNANMLSGDSNLTPEKRVENALKRFNKISTSEIVTPDWVCSDMINLIGKDELIKIIKDGGIILDIASKTGEFAYSIYNLLKDDVEHEILRNSIYSIPTSSITYEFTRRVYEILDLNLNCISEKLFSYNLLKFKLKNKAGKEKNELNYDEIKKIIIQNIKNTIKGEENVKFGAVVGNPPYQEETAIKETKNGQKRRKSIFQYFQLLADKIDAEYSCMIYPGIRWIHQSGKGMKNFGRDLINDKKLSKLIFYPAASDVFESSGIADGISIVLKAKNKTEDGFDYSYCVAKKHKKIFLNNPGSDLIALNPQDNVIINKIKKFVTKNNLKYVHESLLSQKLFGIESDYVEKNLDKVQNYVKSIPYDKSKKIKLYTNDKSGSAGRCLWFLVDRDIPFNNKKYLSEWQVVVSSAHPGGQAGRENQLEIIDNESIFGRARVALKSFKTEKEAKNFYKYCKSNIIRYAFLMTNESLTSLAKYVPDILNYNKNNFIKFNKDIDKQLRILLNLSDSEMQYIKNKVNN